MDNKKLKEFLWFGYFLDLQEAEFFWKQYFSDIKKESLPKEFSELRKIFSERFESSIKSILEKSPQMDVCVPLSGGMDSRLILFALLKYVNSSDIRTFTWGIPGTFDYEIGNKIAQELGTKHNSYNLNQYKYSLAEEREYAQDTGNQSILFHHPPYDEVREKFKDALLFSGFMGDPLAGGHLPKKTKHEKAEQLKVKNIVTNFILDQRWSEVLNKFLTKNNFIKPEYFIDQILSSELLDLLNSNDFFFLEERLDFAIRQGVYIKSHVHPDGLKFAYPFLEKGVISFFANLNIGWRKERKFQEKYLIEEFSDLAYIPLDQKYGFSMNTQNPAKIFYGRILQKGQKVLSNLVLNHFGYPSLDPSINYIDFNHGFRYKKDLLKIRDQCVEEYLPFHIAKELNLKKVLKKNKKKYYGNLIKLICSLAIIHFNKMVKSDCFG